MSLYLISKLDFYGVARPVAVAKSLAEADAKVAELSAALPVGELSFYCREAVSDPSGFNVKAIANAVADAAAE